MMFMDAIHVHPKKDKNMVKSGGNTFANIDDYLWVVHESWCCVKSPLHLIDDRKRVNEHESRKKGLYDGYLKSS
jgi:hypothetical protein